MALAALLCCLAPPLCQAATPEEVQLLGSDREEAQFLSYLPFTRAIAASGVVQGALAASTNRAGVPAAAMTEALDAFAAALDLERDVRDGDRFYIRYEQTFTAEGNPVGVGKVLWAELRTEARGTIAIHRFRPIKATSDSFWLSSGRAATSAGIKLPLDTITVSSGFGMRADPFDQPLRGRLGVPVNVAVNGPAKTASAAPAKTASAAPRSAKGGPPIAPSPFTNPMLSVNTPTAMGLTAGLVAPGSSLAAYSAYTSYKGFVTHAPAMFMHEGVDLAADIGTPIHAAGDGIVRGAELKGGYGNWIEIDHDDLQAAAANGKPAKISTVYGHLSAFARGIAPGVRVKQGDVIGFVGSTGRSTGPHLHFEILQNGHPTNPMISQTLRPEQLKGGELERFKKVIARDLSQRQSEAGSI
jgi:murein DD-endopeptidase MepM/ murein hydrolase activator NlpD